MCEDDTINPNDLPESLKEVMEMIGIDGVLPLVERFGGVRIFIPKQVGREHVLAWTLGWEVAQRLCRYFGGDTLSVPRASRALRQVRNKRIIEQHRGGLAVRALAQEWGLTERRVYAILAEGDEPREGGVTRDGAGRPGAPLPRLPAPSHPDRGRFRGSPAPAPGG